MSKYLFKMLDYHAVRNADVVIDGITVLAGENGSGKSTLLRWLHYVVKVLCEYDEMVENEAKRKIKNIAQSLQRAVTILRNNPEDEQDIQNLIALISNENKNGEYINETIERFRNALSIFTSILQRRSSDKRHAFGLSRLYYYFDINKPDGASTEDIAQIIFSEINQRLDSIVVQSEEQLTNRTIGNLAKFLSEQLDPMVEILKSNTLDVEFIEDGVDLLRDKDFESPLNLIRSIYFGTERIGNALEPFSFGKNDIRRMLRNKAIDFVSDDTKAIRNIIKKIIGGEVISDKVGDQYGMMSNELRFKNNTGLDIHLKAAATGIISFSYILRLLENGWITRNSILIIDEPEAHLHPQWIVEYARMLVLIHKHLGTKIVVASHNPDMVAAIEAVAATENLLDSTHFYIADRKKEESDIAPRYDFRDCGSDIAPIFDSFNIALDRINLYGPQE